MEAVNHLKKFLLVLVLFSVFNTALSEIDESSDLILHSLFGESIDPLFPGDKIPLTCEATRKAQVVDFQALFYYYYEDGQWEEIPSEDIEIKSEDTNAVRKVTAVLKDHSVKGILCQSYIIWSNGTAKNTSAFYELNIFNDNKASLTPVPEHFHPCQLLNHSTPIVIERFSDGWESRFWTPHFIANDSVFDLTTTTVRSVKLTCVGSKKAEWSFVDRNLTKFRYWKSSEVMKTEVSCQLALLDFNLFRLNSTQHYHFLCQTDDGISRITLSSGGPKTITMDEAEHCVTAVIQQIEEGNGIAGWGVGAGSSVISLAMLIGMVYFKRKLNKAQQESS